MEFACTKLAPDKIIRCAFGLTRQEFELFLFLCHHQGPFTSKGLQKKFDINLATVQRALKKLTEDDLVHRTQTNYEGGGYEFQYMLKSRPHIRKELKVRLDHWVHSVEQDVMQWSKNQF